MKSTYLGTTLGDADYRIFGVRAAEQGISKAELLRRLALKFISANPRKAGKQLRKGEAV